LRTSDLSDRQLRIVGQRRSNADHDNIDQCAQPVQMFDAGRTVDILRVACRGRDPTIERLADLPDDEEIVHRPDAQRAEQIRPGLRQGLLSSTKTLDKALPFIGRSKFTGGEIAKLHSRIQNSVLASYQCHYRPPDPKNPSDFWRNDSGLSVFYERARQKKAPQMSAAHSPANSTLFGNEGHSVSRTLSELQGRRPIRINALGEVLFTLPV